LLCCQVRHAGDPDIVCEFDSEAATDICHLQSPPPGEAPESAPRRGGAPNKCAPPGAPCRLQTDKGLASGPCCSGVCSPAGVCPRESAPKPPTKR
jgi:hypothetical protein